MARALRYLGQVHKPHVMIFFVNRYVGYLWYILTLAPNAYLLESLTHIYANNLWMSPQPYSISPRIYGLGLLLFKILLLHQTSALDSKELYHFISLVNLMALECFNFHSKLVIGLSSVTCIFLVLAICSHTNFPSHILICCFIFQALPQALDPFSATDWEFVAMDASHSHGFEDSIVESKDLRLQRWAYDSKKRTLFSTKSQVSKLSQNPLIIRL